MKSAVAAVVVLVAVRLLPAQEAELAPIIVTGTFELNQKRSVTDLFTEHLLKQIETKRAGEEAVARSPWYYSRVWNYVPMHLESSSSDPAQFFKPQYLTLENQKADWELRKSEKQSLFDRR
jgi:hypothetical protein